FSYTTPAPFPARVGVPPAGAASTSARVPVMSSTVFKQQLQSTPLQGANASFIEALYESYLESPASVPEVWRRFFESVGSEHDEVAHGRSREALGRRLAAQPGAAAARVAAPADAPASEKQAAVSRLIQVYSLRGHQIADLDPLGLWKRH